MLELLIGMTLLIVAVLANAQTVVTGHRLSHEERVRSEGLHVVQQVIQRLRSDEDWGTLYSRLRQLQSAASGASPPPNTIALDDGRRAYLPQAYYADFVLSQPLGDCHILIEVPSTAGEGDPPRYLREDLAQPAFGLPADLDGDGAIASQTMDDTYAVLPVRVIVRWVPPGEASRELGVPTWLRGDR